MRLGALKRHWNRLGRRDPFWAALTDPTKVHAGWEPEQFFRSGRLEVEAVLQRAQQLGVAVPRGRALDFGCGAGRLTQAMAEHFEHVDGVDISRSMLRAARRYTGPHERCSYHLNAAPHLRLFGDATFNFVYSTLTLQHMAPRYSKAYTRELLRVLAPGGLLVFQLPSHRIASDTSAGAGRTAAGRLPPAAFNAHVVTERSSLAVRAGEVVTLVVRVKNRSPHIWPARPDARGRHRITVANHWLYGDGELLQRDDARCPLGRDLEPGAEGEFILYITAPLHDSDYWVEVDLVQENVNWFAERGSETLRIPCRVTGGLAGPPPRRPSPAIAAVPVPALPALPFRERHPRIFRVLRATGVRDVYWTWRHALDAFRDGRDRLIGRLRERVYYPLMERVYQPTIPPLINWCNTLSFAPRMEMHCVSRDDVLALLSENGGRVIDVEEELTPGGYYSCRYWITKD